MTPHPLPIATNSPGSRMSSPTSTKDPEANISPTVLKTYRKPTALNEHEFYLASNSNPNAPTVIPEVSPSRSIMDEIAVQLNFQENKEEIVKSWNKFTCKKIGILPSLKALALSSCATFFLLLIFKY